MQQEIRFEKGILFRNGQPEFMLSADYPYYRDDPANWQPRLRQLRELGVQTVTFYVPWRHHEQADLSLDFTGRTQPNRNVVGFLEAIKAESMLAVVKPGPFIHAETDFGGLPDSVEAGETYPGMLGADGRNRHWHHFLPSPLGEAFSKRVLAWFEAVLEAVVRPYVYPGGPVIATQVLNEGVYSSGQMGPTYYDFSEVSKAEFRRRFGADAAVPHKFEPPQNLCDVLPYLNWSRYQADYVGECYRRYGEPLAATGLPVLTNQNPAHEDPLGMDWWLTRINPERWPVVHYGFTNWIGCVSHSEHAFNRYLLLCKRAFGPNLEENWGFSELYDKRYRFTVVPYFQTLLAIAAGASGFNVYTGVGTAHWDDQLDAHHDRPYPDTAPIGADGSLHPKAKTLSLLSYYLNTYGSEIVTAKRQAPVSWALYPAYAALAGWANRAEDWAPLGVKPPRCGAHALDNFQRTMRLQSRDFHVVNIEEADRLDPAEYPALTLCGGFFMDAATQQRLVSYVRDGGTLVLAHDMPVRDDRMEPCTILRDAMAADTGRGQFRFLPENPFEHGANAEFLEVLSGLGFRAPGLTDGPDTQAWVLEAPNGAKHYFVLSTGDGAKLHRVGPAVVRLPGRSGAILRVVDGQLTAALVKGINDCDGLEVPPFAACGKAEAAVHEPCDLFWTADGLHVTIHP